MISSAPASGIASPPLPRASRSDCIVEKFQRARRDGLRHDARDGGRGRFDVRVRRAQRALCRRLRREFQRRLGDQRERAFRADQQAREVVTGRAFRRRRCRSGNASPVPATARSPSMLSRVAPYFTARGPPALQARLPPIEQYGLDVGSGGQKNPCDRERGLQIAVEHAGFDDGERLSGSMRRMRFMRSNETTTPPLDRHRRAGRVGAASARDDRQRVASRHARTSATTCSCEVGNTTASGCACAARIVVAVARAALLRR